MRQNDNRTTSTEGPGAAAEGARARRTSDTMELGRRAEEEALRADRALAAIVGESAPMRAALATCRALARSDIPFLVQGELGTGKRHVVEHIHAASSRAEAPLVRVDAVGMPHAMLEAVLFGTAGGRPGALERAHGGTLLFTAVDELEAEAQASVLCVLSRGGQAGGAVPADVRIVASARASVEKLVAAGAFREDLFLRMSTGRLALPPLRARGDDAAVLARRLFIAGGAEHLLGPFLRAYVGYDWPGNVRELECAVARTFAFGEPARDLAASRPATEEPRRVDFLERVVEDDLAFDEARTIVMEHFRRLYIERALAHHGGNVTRAAAASGIARRTFQTMRARMRRE